MAGSLEQVESKKLETLLALQILILIRILDGKTNQLRMGVSHLVGKQKAIGMLQYLHPMVGRKEVKIKLVGMQEKLQMVQLEGLVKLLVGTLYLVKLVEIKVMVGVREAIGTQDLGTTQSKRNLTVIHQLVGLVQRVALLMDQNKLQIGVL